MNLREAYEGWGIRQENRAHYNRTKSAFRSAWFLLPTNKHCEWYTLEVLGDALRKARVTPDVKANAASVMCLALSWAHSEDPDSNPAPAFTYQDLMAYVRSENSREAVKEEEAQDKQDSGKPHEDPALLHRHTAEEPSAGETVDESGAPDNDLDIDPVTMAPKAVACDVPSSQENAGASDTDPLAGIDFDSPEDVADALMEQSARIMNDKPKEETMEQREQMAESHSDYAESRQSSIKNQTDMKQNKQGIHPPKPVVQLDAETMNPVRTWESVSLAERECGVKNITRAIARHSMAGGYYWCRPEDTDAFKPTRKHNGGRPSKAKHEASASDIVAENEQFREDMKKLMPDAVPASVAAPVVTPKFKFGDRVWTREPKELAGRTGYVKSVDKKNMRYDVQFGFEMFRVLEADLELVNEPVMTEYITKRSVEGLADYTDEELKEELERRGWEGELSRRQVFVLGAKK